MSTANKEAPAVATATKTVELALGLHRLRLSQIDPLWFENSRSTMNSKELEALQASIEVNGMNQNLTVAWKGDGTESVNLIAGYRRYEAQTRIAIKKLVRKYSNDHESEPPIDIDLLADRARLQAAYPTEYQDALDMRLVECKVVECDANDRVKAALLNIDENQNREDVSVNDLCLTVTRLCDKQGVPQKAAAKALGRDPTWVSQIVKIGKMPDRLAELLATPTDVPEDQLPKHLEKVDTVIGELRRRMGLLKGDPCAISFSHARDLANAVDKTGPKVTDEKTGEETRPKINMNTEGLMFVLQKLTGVDGGGNATGHDTPDYGVFKGQIVDGWQLSKPKQAKEETVDVGATAGETKAATVAGAQDGTTTAKAAGEATVADVAKEETATAVTPSKAAAGAAEAAAANAVTDEALVSGAIIDEDDEAAMEAAADEAAGGKSAAEAAATRGQREDASRPALKTPDAGRTFEYAHDYLTAAKKPDTGMLERMVSYANASLAYSLVGLDDDDQACQQLYLAQFNAISDYIDGLEVYAQDVMKQFGSHGLKPFPLQRPTVETTVDDA